MPAFRGNGICAPADDAVTGGIHQAETSSLWQVCSSEKGSAELKLLNKKLSADLCVCQHSGVTVEKIQVEYQHSRGNSSPSPTRNVNKYHLSIYPFILERIQLSPNQTDAHTTLHLTPLIPQATPPPLRRTRLAKKKAHLKKIIPRSSGDLFSSVCDRAASGTALCAVPANAMLCRSRAVE